MLKIVKIVAIVGCSIALLGGPAAKADFLVNGSFESTTNGVGKMGSATNATGWTTNGYNFIFASGGGDTNSGLQIWGPANGSNNGLTASSPDGGNYIGADGAYQVGAITQTITGLTVGQQYSVGFYYAGAQQDGFSGVTTEQWLVSLGSSAKQATPVLTDVSHGFTGWNHATFTFTADSTSDALSFLAAGTPNGEPPFSLLDGVTFTAAPEPASIALMGGGLAALGFVRRRRRLPGKR